MSALVAKATEPASGTRVLPLRLMGVDVHVCCEAGMDCIPFCWLGEADLLPDFVNHAIDPPTSSIAQQVMSRLSTAAPDRSECVEVSRFRIR